MAQPGSGNSIFLPSQMLDVGRHFRQHSTTKKYFVTKIAYLILLPILAFSSCVVDYRVRKNKDLTLTHQTFNEINGEFQFDSTQHKYFLKRFSNDSFNLSAFKIKIDALSERAIGVQYLNNDTIFKSYELHGRLNKNGYFKIKTKLNANFLFGPLLWGLGQNYRALGLTKDKNLVLITDSGGTLFVLFIPLGASSVQFDSEFKRNN